MNFFWTPRGRVEDAAFAADRLRTLLPRLKKHLFHIQYVEVHDRWLETYEAVKAKHDAAVEELRQVYPETAAKLVDLLARIRAIDAEARHVNERKPINTQGEPYDGRTWLPPVEVAARGLSGGTIGGQWDTRLSLDRHLVLPDFTDPTGTKKAWPPHEVPLGALLAQAYR
jgi:hypothetical protein